MVHRRLSKIKPKNFLMNLGAKRPWVIWTRVIVCLERGKQGLGGRILRENGA